MSGGRSAQPAKLISDWLDGGAAPDPGGSAPRTRQELDESVSVLVGHAALEAHLGPEAPGEDFTARVMGAIDCQTHARRQRFSRTLFGVGLAVAACLLAAVVFWPRGTVRPAPGKADVVAQQEQPADRHGQTPSLDDEDDELELAQVVEGAIQASDDGIVLEVGDRVETDMPLATDADQTATVRLADGSFMDISAGAKVVVLEPSGSLRTRVRVDQGRVLFTVTRGGGEFRVDTPAGRAVVLGTQFAVEVDYENEEGDIAADPETLGGEGFAHMSVRVLSGKVRSSDLFGTTEELTGGQWLSASANRPVETAVYRGAAGAEDLAEHPIPVDRRPGRARLLARFDEDRDGRLSRAERTVARSRSGDRQRRRLVKSFDSDGDGKLSPAERANARARVGHDRRRRRVGRYDADGDGRLDAKERERARREWRQRWGGRRDAREQQRRGGENGRRVTGDEPGKPGMAADAGTGRPQGKRRTERKPRRDRLDADKGARDRRGLRGRERGAGRAPKRGDRARKQGTGRGQDRKHPSRKATGGRKRPVGKHRAKAKRAKRSRRPAGKRKPKKGRGGRRRRGKSGRGGSRKGRRR